MKLLNIFLGSFAFAGLAAAKSPGSRQSASSVLGALKEPVRLILTDIDGTLSIQDSKDFVVRNREAFVHAPKLGISIGVATGRSLMRALSFFGSDHLQYMNYEGNPGAYYSGCYVLGNGGEVLKNVPFPPELVEQVVDMIAGERMLPRISLFKLGNIIDGADLKNRGAIEGVYDDVYQLRFGATPDVLVAMRAKLEERFGTTMEYSWTADGALEMAPPGCSKGAAVELIASSMGIPIDSVVVLGNGENDKSMFQVAGAAIAVEDSSDQAFNAADGVGAHSRDGALAMLVQLIEELRIFPDAVRDQEQA